MSAESQLTEMLRSVEVGGGRPGDVQAHDERLYQRILSDGSLGAGEAYMDGWRGAERLAELFFRLLRAGLDRKVRTLAVLGRVLLSRLDTDCWIAKYIFPGGVIPSAAQLIRANEGLFVLEDWHNFDPDYDRTLTSWHDNLAAAWPELKHSEGLDERFCRMWRYYLLSSAGAFRVRKLNLWQLVLSQSGVRRCDE